MTVHEEPLTSEPMRPVDSLAAPAFVMPPGACDAHIHIFGPLDRYPSVAHPHYTLPDAKLAHYRGLMARLGLQRFVIVQPSFYDADNRCTLDALAEAGGMARGVVMLEPDVTDAELERQHTLGVRGVRLDLFKRAALPQASIEAYIAAMAARVAGLGWHLQFYSPGWLVRDLLDFLQTLSIDFTIDHMGYMLDKDGLTSADFDRLLGLTREGRCYIKLSAPYRLAAQNGDAAVNEVAKAIVRAAPTRAIWGSDWPHIPLSTGRDTGALLNLLALWAPEQAVRAQILADNPARLLDFPALAEMPVARSGTA